MYEGIDTTEIKLYIKTAIEEGVSSITQYLDNMFAGGKAEENMSRLKQQITIGDQRIWITGSDIQSLINNCIKACIKSLSLRTTLHTERTDVLFGPYAEKFFEAYKSNQELNTKNNRARMFNETVAPRYYNTPIQNITLLDIQTWFNDMSKNYAHETLCKIRNVMSPVLDSAVDDDIITKNPFKSKRFVIAGKLTVHHKAIPHDKFMYIKLNLYQLQDREQKMAVLLCSTGMRLLEVLGLKYEDINDDNIHIQRAATHPERNLAVIKAPKTKSSDRVIPCPALVKQYIGKGEGFILCNNKGDPLSYTESRRSIDKIRKFFDIKEYSAHDFRDTCATEWRESGLPIDIIARLLGHAKTETTERRYVKYRSELLLQARQHIDI